MLNEKLGDDKIAGKTSQHQADVDISLWNYAL